MSPLRRRIKIGGVYLGEGVTPGWFNPWLSHELDGSVEPLGQGEVGGDGATTRNVGAGLYQGRAFPTYTLPISTSGLPSGVTYNTSTKRYTVDTFIEDVVFPGFVTLTTNGDVLNSWVKGPPAEQTASGALAMVEGPATTGQGKLRWCTVAPAVASPYYDAIGRGVDFEYTDAYDFTDGVRGISSSTTTTARISGRNSSLHHAAQFSPDYANSNRAQTHNDVGVQLQGNGVGDENDIYFFNVRMNARHSLSKGNLPPTREQIAAVMLTPVSSRGRAKATFDFCWFYGGMYCINAGSDGVNAYGPSKLVVTNGRFEKPGTDIFGDGRAPDKAFVCDPTLDVTSINNKYLDGTNVVIQSG